MRKVLSIIIPILVCFFIGLTASYFQADAIKNWYPTLIKPALTPPNIVFPIAWSIIYLCMGISIGLIINSAIEQKQFFVKVFIMQLFFNFTWSIGFFYFQNPLIGFINILLLDIFVINYTLKSYPVNKVSSLLFIPYVIWLLFATYLNGYVLMYN
ncbi:tryptophan-rich sensory protein [Parabacteroides sp. GYB001]|uniref:TspO/MBR family protein n=1 Tax=Parabacteroides leei TaxID=2939491 RepID=UPI0020180B8A|nr:TspO/MBR family protein [Parabacteroides leei]MCL3850349.1 tryptophan-rich sensory protein [Parabacteroides leei]